MRIELERRAAHSKLFSVLSPFIALGLTLIAGVIMFTALGLNPINALYSFFIEPLTEIWSVHELIIKATPLVLIAVGLSVCFSSNNWNIGAEGQLVMGAVAGSILPIMYPELTGWWVLILILLMGMAGGAAWAAIPAFFKNRFGANEILTSLMLVYVAQLFLDWLVRGRWRNPEGYNFPESRTFTDWQTLPEIFPSSGPAHYGAVLALIVVFIAWFMMGKTLKGFQVKVIGQAPRAGRFAGFSAKKMTMVAFLISGALAGLAGISEITGVIKQLQPTISPGYGFAAIIVAFLGRLNPLGVLAAGLILALSYLGGEAAQISLGISDKVGRVFQGVLLFFVLASDTLIHYKIKFIRSTKRSAQT
ncbi:MAG: ABC transporter permease [Rhizobiaceae bacterium]|nr:ABC transporter permease [Rhizobiaceae bacterium]